MKKHIPIALAAVLILGAASPALADCCDSILDCAATVATDGVSCAVQEFIDTVKGLVAFVNNLMSEATGATQSATRAAQQSVSETIDQMTLQSERSDAKLAQAAENGYRLANEESQFPVLTAKKVGSSAAAGAGTSSSAPTATARPAGAAKASPAQGATARSGVRVTARKPNAAAATPEAGAASGGSTPVMAAPLVDGAVVKPRAAPARAFLSEMNRASAEIEKEKATGDQDFAAVNRYMATARATEGSGLKSARQIADQAISAPFKNLLSQLTAMLANPTDLTSPSSAIEAAANSIMSNLNVTSDQLVGAITNGPEQAFQSAQPSYTELQYTAARAQRIAGAMDHLYHDRSPAALAALDSLLPRSAVPAATSRASMRTSNIPDHLAFAEVMARYTASRQKAKAEFLQRFQGFSQRMAQYEGVRATVRATRSSIATYRTNFSTRLNAYLSGKTRAEVSAQRDQLVAQARTRWANDPKTRDAVINLLNSETAKHLTMLKR